MMKKMSWSSWLFILLLSATHVSAATFSFVALGDLPYGSDETAGVKYRQLITQINALNPEFSIHVGDFKAGSAHCSDEEFARQRKHFDLFKGALIYTPGDNGAVCVLDFGSDKTSTTSFIVQMPANTSTSALIRLV